MKNICRGEPCVRPFLCNLIYRRRGEPSAFAPSPDKLCSPLSAYGWFLICEAALEGGLVQIVFYGSKLVVNRPA